MKKQKILELTNYSSGICGVFARVREEAVRLSNLGNEVIIFSSNLVKGNDKEKAKSEDKIENVKIRRFLAMKLGGESFMSWNFKKEALKYRPDIIICHSYRHLHTLSALKLKKELKCKVFLVTHAPFVDKRTRGFVNNIITSIYDFTVGKVTINEFDKVIAITKWEYPFLARLGVKKEKIEYIPNGIPEDFFRKRKKKKEKEENKILFLGRISPIKDIETLILSLNYIKDKTLKLEIVGPAEQNYLVKLKKLIKDNNLQNRITFTGAIFEVKKKINKIDSAKIFVLPSKRESMPQSLIEAMAREKIVIASDNLGARDLIQNEKNGYLFKIGDSRDLAYKIDKALKDKNSSKIKKQAIESVEQFSWDKVIKKIEGLM